MAWDCAWRVCVCMCVCVELVEPHASGVDQMNTKAGNTNFLLFNLVCLLRLKICNTSFLFFHPHHFPSTHVRTRNIQVTLYQFKAPYVGETSNKNSTCKKRKRTENELEYFLKSLPQCCHCCCFLFLFVVVVFVLVVFVAVFFFVCLL